MFSRVIPIVLVALLASWLLATRVANRFERRERWSAEMGDGTYKNPVLFADFSDPDVIRVGSRYLLVASTFGRAPGLTLLASSDLVNWHFVGNPLARLEPSERFASPRHADGVWAPSIREHGGKLWIFYPDPDTGIFVMHADYAEGPWSLPRLLLAGKGLIDPCPLWDDDGRAYLIHAWAKSRAGFNNRLTLHEMAPDVSRVLDAGTTLIDGDQLAGYRTLEGPKLYKHDGWYYVFAPAGGVKEGFQAVFRSRRLRGPYQDRIVLSQGKTAVNGPHQGAWVDTPSGQHWFLHFQERGAFGRVVHLQPMSFRDGFPVLGHEGEPVLRHAVPNVERSASSAAMTLSDDFDAPVLAPQWQWSSNFDARWFSLSERPGFLRLRAQTLPSEGSLWSAPAVLTQRLPGPAADFSARLDASRLQLGERAGLVVLGDRYRWLGVERGANGLELWLVDYRRDDKLPSEQRSRIAELGASELILRASIDERAVVRFSYELGDGHFRRVGNDFEARALGRWVGARIGVFCAQPSSNPEAPGVADFEWVRVEAP